MLYCTRESGKAQSNEANMKTIVIAGGTGYIGQALTSLLENRGYQVRILTTKKEKSDGKKYFYWQPKAKAIDENAWIDINALINLAGENIGEKTWTEKRKKEILDSRVISTDFLLQEVKDRHIKLDVYISASATGYYGALTNEKTYTEEDSSFHDFLGETCQIWENAAKSFGRSGIRTVNIRTGVVISRNSTALNKMAFPVKLGLGSALGNGQQFVPWIHLEDLCNIYLKALADENMHGAYNAVSPEFINNKNFIKELAYALKKPFFMPAVPAPLLRLALGEMADLVLEGSKIQPKRLIELKFKFRYESLKSALKEIYPK